MLVGNCSGLNGDFVVLLSESFSCKVVNSLFMKVCFFPQAIDKHLQTSLICYPFIFLHFKSCWFTIIMKTTWPCFYTCVQSVAAGGKVREEGLCACCHWPACIVGGVCWRKYVRLKLFHSVLVNYKIAGRDVNKIQIHQRELYVESWWVFEMDYKGRRKGCKANQAYSWFVKLNKNIWPSHVLI